MFKNTVQSFMILFVTELQSLSSTHITENKTMQTEQLWSSLKSEVILLARESREELAVVALTCTSSTLEAGARKWL